MIVKTLADLDVLIDALMGYETRAQARRQIERLGIGAVDRIAPLITDVRFPVNVRWTAMMLIAAWRYEPALGDLLAVMKAVPNLRAEAARAMEQITGLSIGDDLEEWEKALADLEAYRADAARDEGSDESEIEEDRGETRGFGIFKQALGDIASELKWEDEGYLYLRIPLEAGRKQQVVVTFDRHDPGGRPLATIYTECGPATREAVASITRRNVTSRYGKFLIEGDKGDQKVVMRETVPLPQLTEELARDIVQSMAQEADSLELELTGEDHI